VGTIETDMAQKLDFETNVIIVIASIIASL